MKYIEIVEDIKNFFENHKQVRQFLNLASYDMQARENEYITVLLLPESANYYGNQRNIVFTVYVLDLLNSDRSNQENVFSDTLSVVEDFLSYFEGYQGDWFIDQSSVVVTPVFEQFADDILSGWSVGITAVSSFSADSCDLPLNI